MIQAWKRWPALRVGAVYAAFGGLWIALSDRVLASLVQDPLRLTRLQTYKGWAFVAASTLLLYASIRRELRRRERAEEALERSEGLYRALAESARDVIFIVDRNGTLRYVNRAGARRLGRRPEALEGRPLAEVLPPELHAAQQPHLDAVFASGGPTSFQGRLPRAEGDLWFDTLLTPLGGEAQPGAVLAVARDITEGVRARERIDLQVSRLSALHTIDEAITSSLDLGLTLEILLAHVTAQLGVDAAAVLLLDAPTLTLEYAAGRGFRTGGIKASRLRLGDGHAGRAALERATVFVPDVAAAGERFVRFPLLQGEDFVAYAAVPLVAKGEVKGVLEVFRRAPLDPDPEWMPFLEAISAQAAIAIDNASLFSRLQRSNAELTLAYDATLEGWGRALEFRDEETEGHTERVTEMTLRLARAMGVNETDLVQVRRGSFLHDIGKIGIPDRVLLKPEPLTEEEWAVMRRHPEHAFRLLHPIRFLRPALDIPYAHHERWDGTGYPRGLKGEQIPLAARIFSVVDVWDALVSDRPYHRAWPKEKIRDHLRSQAGTAFDPAVVEAFLAMEW